MDHRSPSTLVTADDIRSLGRPAPFRLLFAVEEEMDQCCGRGGLDF